MSKEESSSSTRVDDALGRLAERYGLRAGQEAQLRRLVRHMDDAERTPTSVRSRAATVDVHVADSLVGLEVEAVRRAQRIADIGSGAGFPGLPLAVALPATAVSLVESQTRRCVYLEFAVGAAGAANAAVVCTRAEAWVAGRAASDVVVARAVASQPVVLEYAAPLLRVGGAVIDWRGKRSETEEEQAMRAAEELGLQRQEVRSVAPFEGALERHLHLYLKVTDTPAAFPRRAGVARRRPLGASR